MPPASVALTRAIERVLWVLLWNELVLAGEERLHFLYSFLVVVDVVVVVAPPSLSHRDIIPLSLFQTRKESGHIRKWRRERSPDGPKTTKRTMGGKSHTLSHTHTCIHIYITYIHTATQLWSRSRRSNTLVLFFFLLLLLLLANLMDRRTLTEWLAHFFWKEEEQRERGEKKKVVRINDICFAMDDRFTHLSLSLYA